MPFGLIWSSGGMMTKSRGEGIKDMVGRGKKDERKQEVRTNFHLKY
jgi:hypothetical protein